MIKTNFSAFQIFGDLIYFSLLKCNGLYSYNMKTGKIDFISYFEKESLKEELHLYSVLYENKIYFIPYLGRYIAIFNPENNHIDYIECDVSDQCSYYKAFIFNDNLWLIPQLLERDEKKEKKIRVVDLRNNTFLNVDQLNNYLTGISKYFFSFGACSNDNFLYIAIYETNKIVKIDMASGSFDVILCDESVKLSTVDYVDGCLFISETRSNQLRKIDLKGRFLSNYSGIEKKYNGRSRLYNCIRKIGEKIYVFPQDADEICFIDENKAKLVIGFDDVMLRNKIYGICGGQIVDEKGTLFLSSCVYDKMLIIKDEFTVSYFDININFDDLDKKSILQAYLDSGIFKMNYEGDISLNDFVNLVGRI